MKHPEFFQDKLDTNDKNLILEELKALFRYIKLKVDLAGKMVSYSDYF